MRNRAFATVPSQKTPSEAPHPLLLADPHRSNRLQRFFQRFSAFQNTELSNSLSPPAEPGVYQCNYLNFFLSADIYLECLPGTLS